MIYFNFNPKTAEPALDVKIGYAILKNHKEQWIEVTPFSKALSGEKKYFLEGQFRFVPDQLKTDANTAEFWTDHACWALENRRGPLQLGFLYPVFPQTILHKAPFLNHNPIFERLILFYVPFKNSTVEDISVLCYVQDDEGVETSEPSFRIHSRRTLETEVLPGIEISIPEECTPEAVIEGKLTVRNPQRPGPSNVADIATTVYLETDAGYLNRSKIEIKNGEGQFLFKALLLKTGETATIKAGFKFYTGRTSKKVMVL